MMADIHPQLRADSHFVGRFDLCHCLLIDDASYPWFVLVPDRENITEIYQLDLSDRRQLMTESHWLSEAMVASFKPDKLNIAAIGNVVPQLHIHHIARYRNDLAWPAPVWGRFPPVAYADEQKAEIIARIKSALAAHFRA